MNTPSHLIVPLRALAHSRSGDKGNRANISVIAYEPATWELLLEQVTEVRVRALFASRQPSKITRHVLPRLQKCTEAYQRRLRSEARNLQADLGGTEMDSALQAVIRITTEDERLVEAASILLITDGEVWNIEHIVATVRQSGHRLFALGVGSAPAESLLRELAEVSGGACEMVSPQQSMQQAVARLLERMRHACAIDCRLESDGELLYQSPSPREISQGDTVHQWAQSSHKPLAAPRQRWTLSGQTLIHQAEQLLWDTDGVLPRLCAAQRLHDTTDTQRQRALAQRKHRRREANAGHALPR